MDYPLYRFASIEREAIKRIVVSTGATGASERLGADAPIPTAGRGRQRLPNLRGRNALALHSERFTIEGDGKRGRPHFWMRFVMVQYYTLQEAAAKLRVTADQLKEMAKKNEVRAFQDRGNLRFRATEINELARTLGHSSDPELQFRDPTPKTSEPKSGGPKTPRSTKHVPAPTDQDFEIPSEEVPLGQDPASAASASKNTPKNPSTRSPTPKRTSPTSPPPSPRPKPGSDSDVRLVGDPSDMEFKIDSEVNVEKSPVSPGPKTPGSSRKSKIEAAPDSGVRIVPLDEASDSDVKIVPDDQDSNVPLGQAKSKTPSDSDIRLEGLQADSGKGKSEDKGHITEEIDLDAEELKAARDAAAQKKQKPKPRGSSAQLPTVSPFELSEPEVNLEAKPDAKTAAKRASRIEAEKKKKEADTDSSGDFELTPTKDLGSSPLELGSDENTPIKLDDDSDEEVGLGELTGPGATTSGINLKEPVDSGISLEQGGSDEMDIEENVPAGRTPKPTAKVDSSSEFELSLDDSDAEGEEGSSSSEFELTLDEPSSPTDEGTSSEFELSLDLESSSEELEGTAAEHSDSEFELTIDEAGGLEMDDSAALEEEDKDIFETDFEVPALEEESGSEAVALDEEGGESSDFDLDVDEDVDTEAESGSEVVPLDEDVDAVVPVKKKKGGRTMVVDEEEPPGEFEDLVEETETEVGAEEVEPDEEEEEAAAPARRSWGVFTPVCATVCSFILFFVCLMSYEMVASMWGYHRSTKISSLLVDPLARKLFDDGSFPKD
jgi:hypothetical protein